MEMAKQIAFMKEISSYCLLSFALTDQEKAQQNASIFFFYLQKEDCLLLSYFFARLSRNWQKNLLFSKFTSIWHLSQSKGCMSIKRNLAINSYFNMCSCNSFMLTETHDNNRVHAKGSLLAKRSLTKPHFLASSRVNQAAIVNSQGRLQRTYFLLP